MARELSFVRVTGPDGPVAVAFGPHGIAASTPGDGHELERLEREVGQPLREVARPPAGLLEALLSGDSHRLKFDLDRLTPFTQAVLRVTIAIPRGETRSYLQIAREVGHPGAARAVGSVMRRNRFAPLIPCHRVVRSGGAIGDYSAAGGAARKRELLEREAAASVRATPPAR